MTGRETYLEKQIRTAIDKSGLSIYRLAKESGVLSGNHISIKGGQRKGSMKGEKIYEYDADVTGVTDYGVTLQAIVLGESPIPPQGARIDVAFEGRAKGRLAGRVSGTDYLRIRADGRMNLDIRAVIETDDGQRIALAADGVATPRAADPVTDLCENATLTTAFEQYAWVNSRQIWGVGTVSLAEGKIHIDGFMQ
jgi:Protein of unknown function (DUF3237)